MNVENIVHTTFDKIRQYHIKEGRKPTKVLISEENYRELRTYPPREFVFAEYSKRLKDTLVGLDIIRCLNHDEIEVVR